jgi:hypothetical protein
MKQISRIIARIALKQKTIENATNKIDKILQPARIHSIVASKKEVLKCHCCGWDHRELFFIHDKKMTIGEWNEAKANAICGECFVGMLQEDNYGLIYLKKVMR